MKVSHFIERIHLSGLKQGVHHGEGSDIEVEVDLVGRLAATIGGLRKRATVAAVHHAVYMQDRPGIGLS